MRELENYSLFKLSKTKSPIANNVFEDFDFLGNQIGAALTSLLGILVLVSSCAFLVFFVFGQVVGPNEIGLRQNLVSIPGVLSKGYESKGLLPGLQWKIPLVSTVHLLPRDFQFIHLNSDKAFTSKEDGVYSRQLRELEIPTTDGSKVKTDITLVLRYFEQPGETPAVDQAIETSASAGVPFSHRKKLVHGGPKELVNTYTTSVDRQLDLFVRQAEDYLKNHLSRLSTSDYYNPSLREKAALSANDSINEAINKTGIELWGTLIRRYVYSEKKIDNQIFAKNLQEQIERLNAAKRKLEEQKSITKDKLAEFDAKIADLRVQGEQEKAVLLSEADRYEIEQRSFGDRLVQEAYAEVDRLKNSILAETKGADIYIAREMAPLLETLQGGIVTDIDPYNVDKWVQKFVPTAGEVR